MRYLFPLFVSLVAMTAHVVAHSEFDHSEPRNGRKLKQTPNEIRIWFTEPIMPALSSIEVRDASGKQVDRRDLHADQSNPALVHLSLPTLGNGSYKVIWSIVARDLHVTKGNFGFEVMP